MNHAKELYEKFNREVNRKTLHSAWETVCEELKGDGLQMESVAKLK